MAFHPDITRKDTVSLALDTANAAVRIASHQLTSNAGTVEIPNADGTSTIMGVGAGETGIAPWVGNTTAPGKPLGITAESHNGAVWVSWGGTLDGGVPPYFDHVQFTAVDGSQTVDMGQLKAAGKVTAAELTAGDTVTITAIAYDDAHAADGSSAPNASEVSDPVTVVVQSAVDASVVKKAQDDAQSALNKAGQAVDTATASKQTSEGAKADAANAVNTANSANDTSANASSTAKQALAAAQSAQKDGVTHYVPQYAQNTDPKTAPKTGWSEKAPDWVAGSYIWSRMIVAYGSGDYETTAPVVVTGNTGEPGKQGDPGKDGKDGTSVAIKGRVPTSSNLPPSASDGDGYIAEDTGHLWVWGSHGFTDVGKIQGDNGLSAYAHKAYANSADGVTDFSTTNGSNRIYMGWYTDNTLADSSDPHKYTWTKVKGDNGAQGVSVATVTPYWALGTVAPAQPAVPTPPSPWVSAEPGYQRDQNLYTTTKFTYDSGAFVYTNVQLDSSYQYSAAAETAARDALQTATNATTVAQTAKSAADNATSTAKNAKSTAASASSVATQAQATAASANQSATSAQTAANLALANAQNMVMNTGNDLNNTSGNRGVTAENGVYTRTFPGNESQVDFLWGSLSGKAIPGHTYSISFDARVDSGNYTSDDNFVFGWNYGWYNVSAQPLSSDWRRFAGKTTVGGNGTDAPFFFMSSYMNSDGAKVVQFRNLSIKDITEAQAAQKAADSAQSTADKAQVAADNAKALANTAQAAAQGAQSTADGKNKIFSTNSEPSHAGLVPGDLWFQTNSDAHVTGIQTWNGSRFVDYLVVANEILVAGSVGTTQIKNGAITTDLLTSNAVTAIKIAAQTITGDKLNVGSVAAAIITSGLFQTSSSGARVKMDSSGITGYNSTGATTFRIDATTGDVSMIGKFYSGDKSVSRVIIDDDYNKISNPGDVDVDGYVAFESHLSNESPIIGGMHSTIRNTKDKVSGAIFTSGIADSSKPAGANLQLYSYEDGNASEGSLMATMHKMDAYHNIAVVDVNSSDDGQVALLRADGPDKGSHASVESRVDSNGNAYVAIVATDIRQVDPATGSMEPIQPSSMVVTQASRDFQSNLGTALTQIQFTTLSGSSLYSLSSGGVKVPYDGLYLVTGSGYYSNQQAGQGRNTFVYKNNAQVAASPGLSLNSASYSIGYALCAPVRCVAGDIIYVKTNGGLAAHQWDKTNVITIARISG